MQVPPWLGIHPNAVAPLLPLLKGGTSIMTPEVESQLVEELSKRTEECARLSARVTALERALAAAVRCFDDELVNLTRYFGEALGEVALASRKTDTRPVRGAALSLASDQTADHFEWSDAADVTEVLLEVRGIELVVEDWDRALQKSTRFRTPEFSDDCVSDSSDSK